MDPSSVPQHSCELDVVYLEYPALQWEFQDSKMEVRKRTIFFAIFCGDIPGNIGLKNRPKIYGRYLHRPLILMFPFHPIESFVAMRLILRGVLGHRPSAQRGNSVESVHFGWFRVVFHGCWQIAKWDSHSSFVVQGEAPELWFVVYKPMNTTGWWFGTFFICPYVGRITSTD